MLDVYKEALSLSSQITKEDETSGTIFDFNEDTNKKKVAIGMENSIAQLKEAIEKAKSKDDKSGSGQILKSLESTAQKEAKRNLDDIYSEVVIDEVNNHLMEKVTKAPGEIIVVLLR